MKPVPHIPHRLDERVRAILDLAAQPPNVHVDRPRSAVEVVAPDPVEQRLAREYLVAIRRQEPQQLVFLVRQVDRAAGLAGLVG